MLMLIPPLGNKYQHDIQAERKVYNTFLKSSNYIIVDTERELQDIDEALIQDGLHLTPEAGRKLAKQIETIAKNYEKRRIDNPEQIDTLRKYLSVEVETKKDSVKHIVGSKGANIYTLESSNRVRISIRGQDDRPVKSLVISGEKEGVKRAAVEIYDIMENIRSTVPCKFYKTKGCSKGDECRYSHSDQDNPNQKSDRWKERKDHNKKSEEYKYKGERKRIEHDNKQQNRQPNHWRDITDRHDDDERSMAVDWRGRRYQEYHEYRNRSRSPNIRRIQTRQREQEREPIGMHRHEPRHESRHRSAWREEANYRTRSRSPLLRHHRHQGTKHTHSWTNDERR